MATQSNTAAKSARLQVSFNEAKAISTEVTQIRNDLDTVKKAMDVANSLARGGRRPDGPIALGSPIDVTGDIQRRLTAIHETVTANVVDIQSNLDDLALTINAMVQDFDDAKRRHQAAARNLGK